MIYYFVVAAAILIYKEYQIYTLKKEIDMLRSKIFQHYTEINSSVDLNKIKESDKNVKNR